MKKSLALSAFSLLAKVFAEIENDRATTNRRVLVIDASSTLDPATDNIVGVLNDYLLYHTGRIRRESILSGFFSRTG